jgi:hypothetical protein
MGHIARNYPHSKDQVRKGKYKRHHAQPQKMMNLIKRNPNKMIQAKNMYRYQLLQGQLLMEVTHGLLIVVLLST